MKDFAVGDRVEEIGDGLRRRGIVVGLYKPITAFVLRVEGPTELECDGSFWRERLWVRWDGAAGGHSELIADEAHRSVFLLPGPCEDLVPTPMREETADLLCRVFDQPFTVLVEGDRDAGHYDAGLSVLVNQLQRGDGPAILGLERRKALARFASEMAPLRAECRDDPEFDDPARYEDLPGVELFIRAVANALVPYLQLEVDDFPDGPTLDSDYFRGLVELADACAIHLAMLQTARALRHSVRDLADRLRVAARGEVA